MRYLKFIAIIVFCFCIVITFALVGCKSTDIKSTDIITEETDTTEKDATEGSVTIHILLQDLLDNTITASLIPEFEKATGIKVECEIISYYDQHPKLISSFMSPTGTYDVLEVDNYWAGEFPAADWIIPLDEYVKRDNFDVSVYIPSTLDLTGYYPRNPREGEQQKLYMIPYYTYSMGLIYRTDLMNDTKLQETYKELYNKDLMLPETLEEYVQLCGFMQNNAGVYGASMQAQRGDNITMEWSNYLFAVGGDYYDENWNAIINDSKAVKAVELYMENISNNAPEGALSYNFEDALRIMSAGEAFSMITYILTMPYLVDPESSKIVDNVAMVSMPGEMGLGGTFGWAIASNSQYKEEAWEFIKWVESFDIAKKRALAGGAPARADLFIDKDVNKKYPFYPSLGEVVAKSKPVPEFQYSTDLVEILGRELSLICTGGKGIQEGLDAAAAELNQLAIKAGLQK